MHTYPYESDFRKAGICRHVPGLKIGIAEKYETNSLDIINTRLDSKLKATKGMNVCQQIFLIHVSNG